MVEMSAVERRRKRRGVSWSCVVSARRPSLNSPGDTLPLLMGGQGPRGALASAEVYGQQCSLPPLPSAMYGHIIFTADDSVVICGGSFLAFKCHTLVAGEAGPVSHMTQPRDGASAVTTLDGTYVLGGVASVSRISSDFLPRHSTTFKAGPRLPFELSGGCAVGVASHRLVILLIAHV